MILTYKYRIKDRSARKRLRAHATAVNQVWNYCVAYQRDIQSRHKAGSPKRKWPTFFDLTYRTAGVSKELGISSGTVSEVCRHFVQARSTNRRAPKFRRSLEGAKRSLGWVPMRAGAYQVRGNEVTYVGRTLRFWEGARPVPAAQKSACFVEDSLGRWFFCVQIESPDNVPTAPVDRRVGLDLGFTSLVTCSDGTKISASLPLRRWAAKLAVAQRAGNYRRQRAINAHVANIRRDHLHKASARLCRENSLIVIGNLRSEELPARRASKTALDAGWSGFRYQLRYKARRHGARYIEVDERFTSQTCSACGSIPASSPKGMGALGMRRWECSDCGAIHDRDINAAINILNVGLSAQPREDESRCGARDRIRIGTTRAARQQRYRANSLM